MVYKENEDKWEAKKADLEDALNNKNNSVLLLERKLRDVNDELLNRTKALKNAESECVRLEREAEVLRRNSEMQREEYQASVADWRNRLEKTVADHLSSCAADMERNASVAREMREKTEEVERLQRLLETEKKQVQSVMQEWTMNFREKSEAVTSKLARLESELARRDELDRNRICDQCENLKKINQTEREEQANRFSSAQGRIHELERELCERERLLCKKREELEALLSEKDKIDNEREEAVNELDRKCESLKEAMFIVDGLREEIATFMTESGFQMPIELKGDETSRELCRQLSRVAMVVEAYGKQFDQLQMRIEVQDKRQCRTIREVDMTETINDLEYRLFAANQKLAVYEKEKLEWKDFVQRLEDREETAKQKVTTYPSSNHSQSVLD
ncbi:hypothetical protein GCK32_011478 [Trichostrongylus colubriformis]|uniref:Uncharacterized protein n=2 Tax=Trichostrongylus colubriformis TaxID=6319 RepID=A0AAN8IJ94_TRICO